MWILALVDRCISLNFVEIYCSDSESVPPFEDAWENLALVYTPGDVSAYLNGDVGRQRSRSGSGF